MQALSRNTSAMTQGGLRRERQTCSLSRELLASSLWVNLQAVLLEGRA